MTPENKVEKHLVDRVKATGGKIRKLKWIGRNGAPDRMVWWPKKRGSADIFFVELKAPGKKPTEQQLKEHKKMRADGLHVIVLDGTDGVDAFVDGHLLGERLCL